MYPEDNLEYTEDTEFTNEINELIKSEVDRRVKDLSFELDEAKRKIEILRNEYISVKQNYEDLQEGVLSVENFKGFRDLIAKENIEDFVELLGFETTKHIDFSGMNTERIPLWFKLLCLYYPEREEVLSILDIFEIDFPEWAHDFKLPSDYDRTDLDYIFDNIGKMYVTNSENFSRNMGFFYRCVTGGNGDVRRMIANNSYASIPWNLLLQNPLLDTDEYIEKIDHITRNYKPGHHAMYFYRIEQFQNISNKLANVLAHNLPNSGFYSEHEYFVENNKDVFKRFPDLAEKYKDKMKSNQFSSFYFPRFPNGMQIEFIKNRGDGNLRNYLDLIQEASISKEEKIELMTEAMESSLDDNEDLLE